MIFVFLKKPAHEKAIILLLLLGGIVARLLWAMTGNGLRPFTGESHNVAVALATTGRFADPLANGGGYTAHVSMLTPLPSAAAYWLFGVDTRLAETALSLWAACLVALSIWLCWRIVCVLGAPPLARIAAVAFVCLVPIQFNLEIREGRSWEVNLGLVLLLWVLLRLLLADRKEVVDKRSLAVTGLASGFLFIVSPPAGLAAVVAIALFHFMRIPLRSWWIAPLAFVLVAGPLAAIWAERNMVQLGEPIALRDNFGMELDISNYSGAVHPVDPGAAYVARIEDIHPLKVGRANEKLRAAGGEVAYYHQLGQEANDWIRTHPSDFLQLSARHFVQYYLPPKWFWGTFGAVKGKAVWLRRMLVWTTAISGLCALVLLAWGRRNYAYVLIVTLACSIPYIIVQPILRYRYLVSSLLIFLAFDGAGRLINYLSGRRSVRKALAREPIGA